MRAVRWGRTSHARLRWLVALLVGCGGSAAQEPSDGGVPGVEDAGTDEDGGAPYGSIPACDGAARIACARPIQRGAFADTPLSLRTTDGALLDAWGQPSSAEVEGERPVRGFSAQGIALSGTPSRRSLRIDTASGTVEVTGQFQEAPFERVGDLEVFFVGLPERPAALWATDADGLVAAFFDGSVSLERDGFGWEWWDALPGLLLLLREDRGCPYNRGEIWLCDMTWSAKLLEVREPPPSGGGWLDGRLVGTLEWGTRAELDVAGARYRVHHRRSTSRKDFYQTTQCECGDPLRPEGTFEILRLR